MLTLEFSAQDVARTRFACSPLWEVVTSVQALKEPAAHVLHLPWAAAAKQRLAEQKVRFELLSALVPIPSFYVPDFLTPVPRSASPTIEEEIAGLLATPPEVVRADLDRIAPPLPPVVAEFRRDPAAGLARLSAEVLAYWEVALAPVWPRIQRLLDGEVLSRGRTMARRGAAGLFEGLHPQVSWRADTLTIAHPAYEASRVLAGGCGLVLVPSVFVWPGVFSQSNPPFQPGLVYPPLGLATLWQDGPRPVPAALAGVIGHSRALLLAELAAPTSTMELSARTGLSAPNVSHHLSALRDAGLVVSHRLGRTVQYLRTPAAETLLAAAAEQ